MTQIDASLRSFVDVPSDSHFSIHNLPFGVFRPRAGASPRVGVAIGDHVVDLSVVAEQNLFTGPELSGTRVFHEPALNAFMAMGRPAWREARQRITELLGADEPTVRDDSGLRDVAVLPVQAVERLLPARIGDYTDFYSSREHATNVGTMFRGPEHALQPNWLHLPVGYHGRSSSIVVSGTDIRRPIGQSKADDADRPTCGPSRLMDFELEMGFFIGPGNELGEPIPIESAAEHIFGMVLVNDWSARDIQKWEYVPLGPFLGKNFATSISPWVVSLEALEPFRCAGPRQDEPDPLPYLKRPRDQSYAIHLEVLLQSSQMERPVRIATSNFRSMYWDISQQLAHHTVNGCNARPGDLMASGTISGPGKHERGSMLELTWRGSEPLELPTGEIRRFLADGDTVVMTGWCEQDGIRVGFGEVSGTLLPAIGV
jgi:fumarylacetoacetase